MAQQPSTGSGVAEPNPFATNPADELPVGLQLTWRLRALIATGQLAAGEQLPSFRRLAGWAGVNLNTVRAVYEGLEHEGLVVSRQGRGTFVADGVDPAPELERIAAEALDRAGEAGIDPRQLAIVAMACANISAGLAPASAPGSPPELPDPTQESEAIEVRQELRRQIARLEAELAAHTRNLSFDLPTAPRVTKAHIAGVEELEQTRDTLIAQLSRARQGAQARARREGEERGEGPLGRAMGWWRAKR